MFEFLCLVLIVGSFVYSEVKKGAEKENRSEGVQNAIRVLKKEAKKIVDDFSDDNSSNIQMDVETNFSDISVESVCVERDSDTILLNGKPYKIPKETWRNK